MVKWFINRHTFELPWESVTNAWWQKYPNLHSLHMTEVDTIDRKMDASTGELVTRRLITASMKPPSWLAAVGFPEHCYVLEETRVNPKTKAMTMKSVNVTGNNLIEIQETCEYNALSERQCAYSTSAAINCFLGPLTSMSESYAFGIHSDSAVKGLKAMEELCDKYVKMGQEGFEEILSLRLDTILLMTDLQTLRQFDFEKEFKNLQFVKWTSKFAEDIFEKHCAEKFNLQ